MKNMERKEFEVTRKHHSYISLVRQKSGFLDIEIGSLTEDRGSFFALTPVEVQELREWLNEEEPKKDSPPPGIPQFRLHGGTLQYRIANPTPDEGWVDIRLNLAEENTPDFEFAEFAAKYYHCLHRGWLHRNDNPQEEENYITTAGVYDFYLSHKRSK